MGNISFTSEFFAGNRRRLRELFTGTAPIVLTAAGLLQRNADMAYPFCQDASFWYFTGIDEPDITLVLDKDREYLLIPPRDAVRTVFEGAIDEVDLKRTSGIDTIFDEHEGWKRLGARLSKAKHVATLSPAPSYIDHFGMYSNPARRRLIHRMKSYNEELEFLDISQHVTKLRMVKQAPELAAMQSAIDITGKGLKQLFSQLKRGAYEYEYEMEADLTRSFRRAGTGHAFPPVIASGVRACTLHNERNDGKLSADELVLLDVGAEYSHYAADISRTVSVGGSPSRQQEAVYTAVLEVHAYARSLLKPGITVKDYEKQIEAFMGEQLRELGYVKSIEPAAVRAYYPHATSHYLGLTAHDAGLYDQPLEPNMVLTVEPGIYIHDEGLGIRIEDDVLITDTGNEVMSKAIPTALR